MLGEEGEDEGCWGRRERMRVGMLGEEGEDEGVE